MTPSTADARASQANGLAHGFGEQLHALLKTQSLDRRQQQQQHNQLSHQKSSNAAHVQQPVSNDKQNIHPITRHRSKSFEQKDKYQTPFRLVEERRDTHHRPQDDKKDTHHHPQDDRREPSNYQTQATSTINYMGNGVTSSPNQRRKKVTPPSKLSYTPQRISNHDELYAKVDKSFYRTTDEVSSPSQQKPAHKTPTYAQSPLTYAQLPPGVSVVVSTSPDKRNYNVGVSTSQHQAYGVTPQQKQMSHMQQQQYQSQPYSSPQPVSAAPREDLYAKVDKSNMYKYANPAQTLQRQLQNVPVNNVKVVTAVPIQANISPSQSHQASSGSYQRNSGSFQESSGSFQPSFGSYQGSSSSFQLGSGQQPQDLSSSWSSPTSSNAQKTTTVAEMIARKEDLSASWPANLLSKNTQINQWTTSVTTKNSAQPVSCQYPVSSFL